MSTDQPHGGRRVILVTGMPRSGTTGVGAALAHAPRCASLYEPLNPESGLTGIEDYFQFPAADGPDPGLRKLLDRVFAVDVRMHRGIWPQDAPWRRAVKTVTGSRSRSSALRIRLDPTVRTIVWKDPFAAFLAPMLREQFGLPVVVTVRPPEAAAASFKRLGWHFDVDRLHRRLSVLTPGAAYLERDDRWERWAQDPPMIGALVWRLLHGYLDTALPTSDVGLPPLLWANSRTLLAAPSDTYTRLYAALALSMTPRARRAIAREYADEGSTAPAADKTHDRHRNVQGANSYWSDVLSPGEHDAVLALTDAVRKRLEQRIGSAL